MKKLLFLAPLLVAGIAIAAVTVSTVPTSLVTADQTLAASTDKSVFEFALSADASETLSSVAVTVNSTTAVAADLSEVAVYKDEGNGTYGAGDLLAGSNSTVNIGSATTVTTGSNNTLTGGKFFVVVKTSSAWAQPDSITVTMAANGIVTSANSPTVTAVTTSKLSAPDLTGPALDSVVAVNKASSSAGLEAGDTVVLTFNEATTKAAVTAANIASTLQLNNGHIWLDGVSSIGGSSWNTEGTILTITLSAGTSLPTIAVGDTVTLAGSVIKDAAGNAATGTKTITGTFSPAADTTGPALQTAVAYNKVGGTSAKEAGDYVVLTFDEATNAAAINAGNINSVLGLNNSHSWLDGASQIGSASWDATSKILTVTLSSATSTPSVIPGDTVTVSGTTIKDAAGNNATGAKVITGSFGTSSTNPGDDQDEDFGKLCSGGVIKNGKLYRIEGSQTVYLAAACRLKPFRGAAVFKARGHKFQDIKVLTTAEAASLTISDKPALPAGGTLVKGSKKTVWFVTDSGTLMGFVSEKAFKRLGFNFDSVKEISDSDLAFMNQAMNIEENSPHPDGAVLKCTTSSTVYMMKGNKKMAFTNPQPYLERGHTWDAIAVVDCQAFQYPSGTNIAQ